MVAQHGRTCRAGHPYIPDCRHLMDLCSSDNTLPCCSKLLSTTANGIHLIKPAQSLRYVLAQMTSLAADVAAPRLAGCPNPELLIRSPPCSEVFGNATHEHRAELAKADFTLLLQIASQAPAGLDPCRAAWTARDIAARRMSLRRSHAFSDGVAEALGCVNRRLNGVWCFRHS